MFSTSLIHIPEPGAPNPYEFIVGPGIDHPNSEQQENL